eukprot:gene47900-36892_t
MALVSEVAARDAAAAAAGGGRRKRKGRDGDQYLCSGWDLCVTEEPCVMCAMALVHSRIARVAFLEPNTVFGGLGSTLAVHSERRLNHHFA